MEKTLKDTIRCGKMIVFDSWLAKNRRAFCIGLNDDSCIVYRGFFGLKVVSKEIFLSFSTVIDVFDYELPMSIIDEFHLKKVYMSNRRFLFENNKKVCCFVKDLYSRRNV